MAMMSLVLAPLSVDASSWDSNPLSGLDKQKSDNISYHTDYNKNGNVAQKSYGWQFSKVCGLELCKGEVNDGSKSKSFLQGPKQNAPQTYSDYLGMSITGGENLERLSEYIIFNGKFFIKGFF